MSTGFGIEVPRIDNEDVFEDMCLDIIKADTTYENAQKNGRRGQRQNGVDIFYRKNNDPNEWLGIQCKVKTGGIIEQKEIEAEIVKAQTFNPKLKEYYIYTTAKRDASIQEFIRVEQNNFPFVVHILFWEDIAHELRDEKYKHIHYKYYSNLYTHIKDDGYMFGKIIHLDTTSDAHPGLTEGYELIIGQTYQANDNKDYMGLNYWKKVNIIMNMNQRTFETFPQPCFSSDLEVAFSSNVGRYFISKWLNTIKNIEEFINSDQTHYQFMITKDMGDEFHEEMREDEE